MWMYNATQNVLPTRRRSDPHRRRHGIVVPNRRSDSAGARPVVVMSNSSRALSGAEEIPEAPDLISAAVNAWHVFGDDVAG